ncbi:hypothetical protein HK100_006072, partial [Physocladia obscura]
SIKPAVVLNKSDGSSVSVSNYLLCTTAQVADGEYTVKWDICALGSSAPPGTYDNAVGATFTFQQPNSTACDFALYEIQVHGVPTPSTSGLGIGGIIGIIVACFAIVLIAGLCFVRQANLRKRAARWLNQPKAGWESLELWAADRAEHHD